MEVLRLGGLGVSSFRILDLIDKNKIEKIRIIYQKNQEEKINSILYAIEFFGIDYILDKIEFIMTEQKKYKSINEVLLEKYPKLNKFNFILKTNYDDIISLINPETIIWVGDNDFDGSNFFVPWLRSKGVKNKIIRSYKETRFNYSNSEKKTLELSDSIIVPNKDYLDFFDRLYKKNNHISANKFYYADLDWRFSKLINLVYEFKVDKLSKNDNEPHICILTGRAVCNPKETRSASRYYYLPLIQKLINQNINVHMHVMNLCPDINLSSSKVNPYKKLEMESNYFHIEKSLNLESEKFNDYKILKRYDAGILHNSSAEDPEGFSEFQKINVPNRLFEYQIAGVEPILHDSNLPIVSKIINEFDFGIIYKDINELSYKLYKKIDSAKYAKVKAKNLKTYCDFAKVFLNSL